MPKICRSIDVGFGLVKMILPVPAPDGSPSDEIHPFCFPAVALPAKANKSVFLEDSNTYSVPVNGVRYEVGPGIVDVKVANEGGRQIDPSYYCSPVYQALMLGALRYMHELGDRNIDVLTVGLPVNQFVQSDRREYLERTYTGELVVGMEGQKVTVHNVVVQPQPLGGYFCVEYGGHIDDINAFLAAGGYDLQGIKSLRDIAVLIVDPGEFTLDWLLVKNGKVHPKASDAINDAGRQLVLRSVKDRLEDDLGVKLSPHILPQLDEALRSGKPLWYQSKKYDLTPYAAQVQLAVADPVNMLIDGLRGMEDYLDLIIMVGGFSEPYRKALQQKLPRVPIFDAPSAVFANVRGYQLMTMRALEGDAAGKVSARAAPEPEVRIMTINTPAPPDGEPSDLQIYLRIQRHTHPHLYRALQQGAPGKARGKTTRHALMLRLAEQGLIVEHLLGAPLNPKPDSSQPRLIERLAALALSAQDPASPQAPTP